MKLRAIFLALAITCGVFYIAGELTNAVIVVRNSFTAPHVEVEDSSLAEQGNPAK